MATNNAGHLIDDKGNVVVDFVWGNMPMQPNDDRNEAVQGDLSATGDNHVIAYAAWNGFPLYNPNTAGAGVGYVNVPSVIGVATATAQDAMDDAGLTVTVATAATNSAKTIGDLARGSGSTSLRVTTATAHGFSAGSQVVISAAWDDKTISGTFIVDSVSSSTRFYVTTAETFAISATDNITGLGTATAVSGTIKTQSVAAGAATIAIGQAVTLTPWA